MLFHDAARPLVDQRIIADCAAALERWQAIGVAVPSSDTIVEVTDGALGRVLPRDALRRCQTPQGFRSRSSAGPTGWPTPTPASPR